MLAGVKVREFDRELHREQLKQTDTSFESDRRFDVGSEHEGLRLFLKSLESPLRKSYIIEPDEDWTRAYVAVIDEVVRAFLAMEIQSWNRRVVIRHLYVDKKFRRQGIGKSLIKKALDYGRANSAVTAWVEVTNINYPAVEAYRRLGFSLCGFDTSYYQGTPSEGEFALFMSMPICNLENA